MQVTNQLMWDWEAGRFRGWPARHHEPQNGVGQQEEGIDSRGFDELLFLLLRCFAEGAFLQLAFTAAGCLMNQECGYHKQQVDSHQNVFRRAKVRNLPRETNCPGDYRQ